MALGADLPPSSLGIVRELSERPQWVVWKDTPTEDGKKIRKVPISPLTGRNVSVKRMDQWSFYDEACKYALATDVNGVGFVLTGLEGYTVIDLDTPKRADGTKITTWEEGKVRDADTGEISPWARDVVERFNSYAEISPSGTGLHIWCRGRPSGKRCRSKSIEMYTTKRYITITGRMVDLCESDEIEDRQELINQLYEETFETVPVHGDPPPSEPRPTAERDTQSDYDDKGWPYPAKQQWTLEQALPWCQKALQDGTPHVPHSKLLALNKNDRRFNAIWNKKDARSIESCGLDTSRWDLAIANRLFLADIDLTWHEMIAILIDFRSQYDKDETKMMRADYWARTIAKASDKVSLRKEREAERVADEIAIHTLQDIEERLDRVIDGDASKPEKKAALNEMCSTVGIPEILRITRAKQKNNHIFTIHFGDEDHDKIDGDATLLTSQAKFRTVIASQLLRYIKPMTPKKWALTATLLLKAVEEEDHLPSVATAGQTIELLQSYLISVPRPPDFASETYLQDGPWFFKGKLVFKLSSFEIYLRRVHRMGIPRVELARRLRDIGVRQETRSYRIGDKVSSLSAYVVPDENNFHDLANSIPRTIEVLSDGESEEEKA